MNELSERDRLLAERLRATLERSASQPDATLDTALAAARARALASQRSKPRHTPWLWASGMALAAGLAMFVVLPGGSETLHAVPQIHPVVNAGSVANSKPVIDDPEMLDDMDMLQALAAQPDKQG